MSSIAVERLLKCIMLLNFRRECFVEAKEKSLSELANVKSIYGIEPFYYGYHGSSYKQIYKFNDKYYVYKIGLKHSMENALSIGFPVDKLLDKNEESKLFNKKDILFIVRRNNAAHGFYTDTNIGYEQIQYIESNERIDMAELLKFGRDAYDQYKKASNFVIDTLIKFESEYDSI